MLKYIYNLQKKGGVLWWKINLWKSSLSTILFLLSLIVIVFMGIYIWKIDNAKTVAIQKSEKLQAQVNTLNSSVNNLQEKLNKISDTINSKEEKTASDQNPAPKDLKPTETENKEIVLDGIYSVPNSDSGWLFSKDGKAAQTGNVSTLYGTYKTTNKNTVEAHYTKSDYLDIDTGKSELQNIDSYVSFTVDENNNVYWTNVNGGKVQLQRGGDVSEKDFKY